MSSYFQHYCEIECCPKVLVAAGSFGEAENAFFSLLLKKREKARKRGSLFVFEAAKFTAY